MKSHRDLDNVGDSAGIELHVIDHRTPQLCYGLLSEPFSGVTHTTVPVLSTVSDSEPGSWIAG